MGKQIKCFTGVQDTDRKHSLHLVDALIYTNLPNQAVEVKNLAYKPSSGSLVFLEFKIRTLYLVVQYLNTFILYYYTKLQLLKMINKNVFAI